MRLPSRRTDRLPIEQRYRLAKRLIFGPVAPIVRRWALTDPPDARKALALRRVVVPGVGAAARDYERTVSGGFRFGGNTRDLLGLMVNLFGVWEPNLSSFIQSRLARGDTFVDVGANSGWFTTMAATKVGPTGRVVAVEASPVIAERLRGNLARNGLDNVRVLVAAATSEPGFVDVLPGPAEHTGLTQVRKLMATDAAATRVPADTLPALLTDEEIATARVVKIDVEGAEYDVIAGLAASLHRFPATCEFVVEVGPDRARTATDVTTLIETFTGAGYNAYYLPNFYDVHSYLLTPVATSLERLEGPLTEEKDIVFSRHGGPRLPM